MSNTKELFNLLETIYAEAVACEVAKLAKERCCGCEYEHPSQREHDCLMLSEEERWQTYGLEAIERVFVKRMVWLEFIEAVRVMKLEYHEEVHDYFESLLRNPDPMFIYSLEKADEFVAVLNYLSYWRDDT